MDITGVNFERLLEAVPDCVMVVDVDVRLIYVNDAAEELLGWRGADWVGRGLLALVHPDDIPVALPHWLLTHGDGWRVPSTPAAEGVPAGARSI